MQRSPAPWRQTEWRHYVLLQVQRVQDEAARCHVVGGDIELAAEHCLDHGAEAVRVRLRVAMPWGELRACHVDTHAYLAVRGAFDQLLCRVLRSVPGAEETDGSDREVGEG